MYVFVQEAKMTPAPDATKDLCLGCWMRLKIKVLRYIPYGIWYYDYIVN